MFSGLWTAVTCVGENAEMNGVGSPWMPLRLSAAPNLAQRQAAYNQAGELPIATTGSRGYAYDGSGLRASKTRRRYNHPLHLGQS